MADESVEESGASLEDTVRACYAGWSGGYFEQYHGDKAAYPPVHRDIIAGLLDAASAGRVLDAVCGPASLLRCLGAPGRTLYGFDLTPEMVEEARRVMAPLGLPPERLWVGSVTRGEDFAQPDGPYDAAICTGVLPHIPEQDDRRVLDNLRGCLRPGGLAVLEARNEFFGLFTLNRYTMDFFEERLIRPDALRPRLGDDAPALDAALDAVRSMLRTDLPPRRAGYDEILSRAHNPLVLREQMERTGFRDVRVLFYHFHCLPPMFEQLMPASFREASLAMEDPEDWRGYFMASAFLLAGVRA